MNKQFIWVVFGILVIHLVAISAFMKSSADRHREQARADLPSAEEMGTSVASQSEESVPVGNSDPVRTPDQSETIEEKTEVAETTLVEEKPSLKPTYTPETEAIPEPAPLVPEVEPALEGEPVALRRDDEKIEPKVVDPVLAEPSPTKNETESVRINADTAKGDSDSNFKVVSKEPVVVATPVVFNDKPAEGRAAFLKPIAPNNESPKPEKPKTVLGTLPAADPPAGTRKVTPIDISNLPRINP